MSSDGMPITKTSGGSTERILEGTNTLHASSITRSTDGDIAIDVNSGYSVKINKLQFQADISRYGFINRTETTIAFDGTDKFTLTDAGSSWSYYRSGVKHTITGNKDVTVASPMVDGTLYYIFIDATTGALSSSTSPWTLNDTKVPVATLFWDSTLTPKYLLSDERHTCLIDRRLHRYEHVSEGTKFLSGGTLSGLTPSSDTPGDKTFGIAATNIADEDIFLELAALADPDGATAVYYNLYRTSTTRWKWAISDMPFKYANLGGSTYGFIEYDNGSGVSTQASNNQYVNTYVVVSNAVANSEADPDKSTTGLRYFIVQGRGAFSSPSSATAESFGSFNLTGFPVWEAIAIYQITWATTNRPNTVKGRCRYVSTQRITANIVTTTVSASADHNTLSGIQGGTSGQYYHLTEAQYDALTKMYGAMADSGSGIVAGSVVAGAVHPLVGFATGPVSGISFNAGVTHGDVTAIATYGGGAKIQITTTAVHDVVQGDYIAIVGTTNYDGLCQVTDIIGANDFAVNVAWIADEVSGSYGRGDALIVPVGGAGDYKIEWAASAVVSASAPVCYFGIAINDGIVRPNFQALSSAPESFSGMALLTLADGDVVWFGYVNEEDTNDIEFGSLSFAIHRL